MPPTSQRPTRTSIAEVPHVPHVPHIDAYPRAVPERRRSALPVVALVLASLVPAPAHATAQSVLETGDTVRITWLGMAQVYRLVDLRADTFVVSGETGEQVRLAAAEIGRLEVRTLRTRLDQARHDGLIAWVAGLVIGGMLAGATYQEYSDCLLYCSPADAVFMGAMAGGTVGGTVGMIVGAIRPPGRAWRAVPVQDVRAAAPPPAPAPSEGRLLPASP